MSDICTGNRVGVIDSLEKELSKKCFATHRHQLDWERSSVIEYDFCDHSYAEKPGETERILGSKDISRIAEDWRDSAPAFRFFLDGSRRTYKIADIPIDMQCYPLVAGQVGVGVCERKDRKLSVYGDFHLKTVLSVSRRLDSDGKNAPAWRCFFDNLRTKINENLLRGSHPSFQLDEILFYEANNDDNFEDKAIASIQDYMIELEKKAVSMLVQSHKLNDESWLLKDGSLEYAKVSKGDSFLFSRIRNNYRHVVGVSKSFNPGLVQIGKGSQCKSASRMIAELKPFHRTPAFCYRADRAGGVFAVWYLRLRDSRQMNRNLFDGVVKVEKVLVTKEEEAHGLETAEVDAISAWILNERNPVCYGKDSRWANHLYPIYLTETFVKSQYMSALHFVNLF